MLSVAHSYKQEHWAQYSTLPCWRRKKKLRKHVTCDVHRKFLYESSKPLWSCMHTTFSQ